MRTYTYELIGYKLASNSELILRFKTAEAAQEVRKSIIDSIASYPGVDDDSFKNIIHMYTNANDCDIYFNSWDSRENFIRRHIKHEGQKMYYMTVSSTPYIKFNQMDSFTCTIDDADEEVRKMLGMNIPYTFTPKTDDLKSALNSVYGFYGGKNMKKLIDTDSIYLSTAGYDQDSMTKDFAKLRRLVVDSPLFTPNIIVAPKEWTSGGYKKLFDDATSRMHNVSFTFEYKEDKNLDRVIRKVQINEKKKVVTIVWKDGEVTMAKCGPNDTWDPEKGVLVCVAKRFFNSNTQFSKWLKSVIPEEEEDTKSLLENIVEGIKNNYQPKHAKEDSNDD